jgi:hypothetical protein
MKLAENGVQMQDFIIIVMILQMSTIKNFVIISRMKNDTIYNLFDNDTFIVEANQELHESCRKKCYYVPIY